MPGSIGFGATGATNTGIAGLGQQIGGTAAGSGTLGSAGFGVAAPAGAGIPAGLTGAPGGALPAGYGAAEER
jgi:hypothetical protein